MLKRKSLEPIFKNLKGRKPIIDIHTHAGFDHYEIIKKRYPSSQSVKDLVFKMKNSGVSFGATFPCPNSTYYFDLRSIPKKEHVLKPLPTESYPYEFSNRQLFYETSLFGEDKIMPFAFIFPGFKEKEQIKSLEKYVKEDILFGLKHHTLVGAISANKLIGSPFMEFARDYSLPIIIHSGVDKYSRPENIIALAKHYPDLRFCIAHAGEFEKNVFDIFLKLPNRNVFFDTSPFISICNMASSEIKNKGITSKLELDYANPKRCLVQLNDLIPDNLVWGTDEPWTTITDDSKGEILLKVDYKDEVDLLNFLPRNIKQKISFNNSIRFLFG